MTNGILNMVVPLGWYYSVCMETLGGCRMKKGWQHECKLWTNTQQCNMKDEM